MNWEEAADIDGEEERSRSWILEAVELGNEGAYNLSHTWNTVRGRGWGESDLTVGGVADLSSLTGRLCLCKHPLIMHVIHRMTWG